MISTTPASAASGGTTIAAGSVSSSAASANGRSRLALVIGEKLPVSATPPDVRRG